MAKVEIRIPVEAAIVLSGRTALGRSESLFLVVVFLSRVERMKGVRPAVRTVVQKLVACLNGQLWVSVYLWSSEDALAFQACRCSGWQGGKRCPQTAQLECAHGLLTSHEQC